MSIAVDAIIKKLEKTYPDKIIYKQTYSSNSVGTVVDYAMCRAAKDEGITRGQWLQNHGFNWIETGYVEPDMRPKEVAVDSSSAYSLAKTAIERYPLAGQYEPSQEEMGMLFTAAQKVFRKMAIGQTPITNMDQIVLVFTTIQLLKNRESNADDESADTTFWDYIYLQYGYKSEESDSTTQRVYQKFCAAITYTFSNGRFMATEGHKYYSTMLLHAISPKQSIFNLYDVLFDFYIKNLNYQYEPEDPIYAAFVTGMQSRWNNDTEIRDELQLRCNAVTVGLKILFQKRPGYMAKVCDCLVNGIDRLVRDEQWSSENRWDSMLKIWFQEKSYTEKSQVRNEKKQHRTEFVATTAERIYAHYVIEGDCVGIQFPQIRLVSDTQSAPCLTLKQGNVKIYSEPMKTIGNELGRTTKRVFLPLKETGFDFSGELELSAEIKLGDDILYTSGSKLNRKYILFDATGAERDIRKGKAYLFGNDVCSIEFYDEEDVYQENHPGQLLRMNLDQVGTITVNGVEIFADEKQSGNVRLYPSVKPVRGIWVSKDGTRAQIFDKPFHYNLCIPRNENRLQYRVMQDNEPVHGTETIMNDEEAGITFECDNGIGELHTIRILDLSTSNVVLETSYVYFPTFSYRFNKELYLETEYTAVLTVSNHDSEVEIPVSRQSESDIAVSDMTCNGLYYEAELPVVHGSLGETSLFELPSKLWHESVAKGETASLSIPDGWKGALMLGTNELVPNSGGSIDLGNYLQSGRIFRKMEILWLSLRSGQKTEQIKLTDLIFQPMFTEPPIIAEKGCLNWIPEGVFYGKPDAKFQISVTGKNDLSFKASTDNCCLTRLDDACRGEYRYTVSMIPPGLFLREPIELFSGEFFHGDKKAYRFMGKELTLTSATYWNLKTESPEDAEMRPGNYILSHIVYEGDSIPSGEFEKLPEYSATLLFVAPDGRRIRFNSDETNSEYEWINPARVWIVNENRLILRGVTDDAVYFDTQYNSIMNRNPDTIMRPEAQKTRLQTPDYFEYKEN